MRIVKDISIELHAETAFFQAISITISLALLFKLFFRARARVCVFMCRVLLK